MQKSSALQGLGLPGKLRYCGLWESSSEEMNLPFGSFSCSLQPVIQDSLSDLLTLGRSGCEAYWSVNN